MSSAGKKKVGRPSKRSLDESPVVKPEYAPIYTAESATKHPRIEKQNLSVNALDKSSLLHNTLNTLKSLKSITKEEIIEKMVAEIGVLFDHEYPLANELEQHFSQSVRDYQHAETLAIKECEEHIKKQEYNKKQQKTISKIRKEEDEDELFRMREYFSFLVKEIDVLINLRHSHSADMAEMNDYFTDAKKNYLARSFTKSQDDENASQMTGDSSDDDLPN